MDARLSYREAAVRGASPVGLVVLLYDQVLEDLRRAVAACGQGAIEIRTREINHAILVLGQLQGSLDMERGGAAARNLDQFYTMMRQSLVQAQCQQSVEELEQQITHLMLLREAWVEVDQATAAATAAASTDAALPPEDTPPGVLRNWSA